MITGVFRDYRAAVAAGARRLAVGPPVTGTVRHPAQ